MEGLIKESFSPGKERQDNEKRSLFVVQSGDNGAHSTDNTGNENTPEISTPETPPSPSEMARGAVFSHSTLTSDTNTDRQKPEVKRKFSHASLNKIASAK